MKGAMGLARVPVLVAVLVVAAGGATIRVGQHDSGEAPEVPAVAAAAVEPGTSYDGEAAFLGEMTVSASRIRD